MESDPDNMAWNFWQYVLAFAIIGLMLALFISAFPCDGAGPGPFVPWWLRASWNIAPYVVGVGGFLAGCALVAAIFRWFGWRE